MQQPEIKQIKKYENDQIFTEKDKKTDKEKIYEPSLIIFDY
jgi:hypothetical protein